MTKAPGICLLVILMFCSAGLFAQQDVPDLKFQEAISLQCPACIDGNGNLTAAADTLLVLVANDDSIADITGVAGFTSLTEFYCSGNLITTLPELPNSLQTFFCSDNLISVLPDSLPSQLQGFKCENNNLTSLPLLPNTLTQLFCSNNNLTSLPVLPPFLESLTCNDNSLSLLPALPPSLTSLHCNVNHLVRLPELPPSLEKLYCSQNSLSSLPELPASLISLDVSANPISCFPLLPMNIQTIIYVFTNITCLPNFPYIFQSISPLPLCVGDSTGCTLNPKVSGMTFIDYNANGIKDGADVFVKGMKITTAAGNWIGYTDSIGKYEMSIGLHNTITISPVVPPGIYTMVPPSLIFTTSDTSGQKFTNSNFALQPAGNNYDFGISLTAGIAVPSSPTVYTLTYKNNSAFLIDATIQLVFDPNLSFVSADVAPTTQIGSTLGWDISLLPPFASKSINVVFNVSGNETPGDILTSSVSSTLIGHTDLVPSNNSQTVTNEVRSSIVTNYLTVSEDTISMYDVTVGKYLEYILYFRNTGSAVVNKLEVIDTLSSFLDADFFELLGMSHHGSLEITNADFNLDHPVVLHWTFNNIHLPPMNSDSVNSCGSIDFLVKVGSNVYQNALISNKAYILFDYTSIPFTTSTSTLVLYPIGIANVLNDETIHVTPNPFSDLIDITGDKFSSAPTVITVYDLAGKKIRQQSVNTVASQKFNIDFSDLSSGAYLMTLETGEGISSFKIFKQ
ncbi:MAG TPA: T9SS type A sorting domain-containing protein [Chitinophagales bacterium]|nr:T9SS type A sorting domain-containing protein [Chitinophagales bacterium]